MKNFVGNGNTVQLTAPVGGVVGGAIYGVGGIIGVIVADAAEGDQVTLQVKGMFESVKKKAGEAWAIGDKLYYDPATGELTKTAGSLQLAGFALAAALSADVVGSILLD